MIILFQLENGIVKLDAGTTGSGAFFEAAVNSNPTPSA